MQAHLFTRFLGIGLLVAAATGCGDSESGNPANGSGGSAGSSSGSGGSSGTGGGSGGGSQSSTCGSSADPFVLFADETHNYTFQSSLMLDVKKVAPKTMLEFDWSQLSANFQGHPLSTPEDIDSVVLIVWNITPQEIAQKINEDAGDLTSYVQGTVQFPTGNTATSARLDEFTAFGSPVPEETLLEYLDPEVNDPATHSYTLMAQKGTTLGVGVQMIQAFQIDPAETTTTVTMTNESTTLDWDADLSALTPMQAPAGQATVTIDWSDIDTRGYGGEFVPNRITQVIVGRLTQGVSEIEDDFLNLEFIAEDVWRGDVASGVRFDLSKLTHDETGEAFPGFSADGTWVLGLLCTSCTNPTPWYITRVETCP